MNASTPSRDPNAARLRLADILAALSVVTDLGHGQAPETAMRVCVVATCLADRLGLSATERANIYFASMLRHIGCTAYAHEEAVLFAGEEIAAPAAVAVRDPANPREMIGFTISNIGAQLGPFARAGAVATSLVRTPRALNELAASNCEVGSMMARRLDLPDAVQTALNQVYERWDGKGWPHRLAGESLSLAVRVTTVADVGIALTDASDFHSACDVVAKRAGAMLDPEIANSFSSHGQGILEGLHEGDVWETVLASEPEPHRTAGETRLDGISHAFADMADLKLTFTRSHSSEVARLSEAAAAQMGLDTTEIRNVKRAALFHDLGRVAIPKWRVGEAAAPVAGGLGARAAAPLLLRANTLSFIRPGPARAHGRHASRAAGRKRLSPATVQDGDSLAGQNPGGGRYLSGDDEHAPLPGGLRADPRRDGDGTGSLEGEAGRAGGGRGSGRRRP
jgi:HD-GYP domain-containing protein (c-di-GMP phosphodiesterase class II)